MLSTATTSLISLGSEPLVEPRKPILPKPPVRYAARKFHRAIFVLTASYRPKLSRHNEKKGGRAIPFPPPEFIQPQLVSDKTARIAPDTDLALSRQFRLAYFFALWYKLTPVAAWL